MYNPYQFYNPQTNVELLDRKIENATRQLEELNKMKKEYGQPVNNFINTQPSQTPNTFEMKVLNDGEEAENIGVLNNTIFMGSTKIQIKKLDGTIEKYNVEKYYPVDPKDEKIKELNMKLQELERRLNNEHGNNIDSTRASNESNATDDVVLGSESKTSDE